MVFVSFYNDSFIFHDRKTDFNIELFPTENERVYAVFNTDIITDDLLRDIPDEENEVIMESLYHKIMKIILQLEDGLFDSKKYDKFSDIFRESKVFNHIIIKDGLVRYTKNVGISYNNSFLPPSNYPKGISILNSIGTSNNFLEKNNYHKSKYFKDYLPLIKGILKKIRDEMLYVRYFTGTKEDAIIKCYRLFGTIDSQVSINIDYGEDIFIIEGGIYMIIMDNSEK